MRPEVMKCSEALRIAIDISPYHSLSQGEIGARRGTRDGELNQLTIREMKATPKRQE